MIQLFTTLKAINGIQTIEREVLSVLFFFFFLTSTEFLKDETKQNDATGIIFFDLTQL